MLLKDKKRESIIAAAIAEFQEQGFLGAKTTQIAKRASVSSRTLYKHFPSKEDLFNAIAAIMVERNNTMAPIPYDPARAIDQQLLEALRQYVDVITEAETMGLNRVIISELLRDLDRSRAFFAEMATHDYPITQLISEAMDAGVLRAADPSYAANQLLSLAKNFFFWPEFFLGAKQDMPQIMEDCVSMFLKHYTETK